MIEFLSIALLVWMATSAAFVLFGPMSIAEKRNTKLDSGYVFGLTILALPTVIGWVAVLTYSLLGETKET